KKQVCLEFADTGGGIPGDYLDRVFDPFFTSKEVGEGTGLGLSISYGIIKDHKGEIEAFNNDSGAVFKITLPVERTATI
ncbi:MAG: ATP-binding protein, partial [Nitrospinota bacterium]|nr:ATP-binding protein [Nitrospinota bacterium]